MPGSRVASRDVARAGRAGDRLGGAFGDVPVCRAVSNGVPSQTRVSARARVVRIVRGIMAHRGRMSLPELS